MKSWSRFVPQSCKAAIVAEGGQRSCLSLYGDFWTQELEDGLARMLDNHIEEKASWREYFSE